MQKSGFLHYRIVIVSDFWPVIEDFWPILGDIGSFLRPNLRGKLGDGYQLHIYIYKPCLLEARRGYLDKVYAEHFPSQSHFYVGKLLRTAPLQAISRRFVHLI
jgi:hypothetical protein